MKDYKVPGMEKRTRAGGFTFWLFMLCVLVVYCGGAMALEKGSLRVPGIFIGLMGVVMIGFQVMKSQLLFESFSELERDHLDLYQQACTFEEKSERADRFLTWFRPSREEVHVALLESARVVYKAYEKKLQFLRGGMRSVSDAGLSLRDTEIRHDQLLQEMSNEVRAANDAFRALRELVMNFGYSPLLTWKHYVDLVENEKTPA